MLAAEDVMSEGRSRLSDAIAIVILFLMATGAVMVFSAGANLGHEFDLRHFYDYPGLRQIMFFPMAVVTSIAVTYLPTTLRQFRQIREAQAVRGHQLRSIRDWLPLLMPLLVGGLEHAMQLAEAMTARGFAKTKVGSSDQQVYPRLSMLLGLLVLTLGWIAQLAGVGASGLILIIIGAAFILGGLWFIGRQSPRSTYHRQPWGWRDWLSLCSALVVLLACLLPLSGLGSQTLDYEPYPALSLPAFSPLLGTILLGLVTPGLLVIKSYSITSQQRNSLKDGHHA